MSASQYRTAMDKAWAVADSRTWPTEEKATQVALWLRIAEMELQEPVKRDRPDAFNWAPPAESDPSVVGTRCSECQHFEDNHTDDGCRECGCEWVSRVAL
jgi:hypothetical protein